MLPPGRLLRVAVTLACLIGGVTLGAALRLSVAGSLHTDPAASSGVPPTRGHATATSGAPATGGPATSALASLDASTTMPTQPRVTPVVAGGGGAELLGRRVLPGPLDGPGVGDQAPVVAAALVVVVVLAAPRLRRPLRRAGPGAVPRGPPTGALT